MDKFKFKEFSTPSESENDRLREENARLREAVQIKGESLRECQDAVSRLRSENEGHKEEVKRLVAAVIENANLSAENASLRAAYGLAKRDLTEAEAENAKWKTAWELQDHNACYSEHDKLRSIVMGAKIQVQGLSKALEKLEGENARMREELEQTAALADRLGKGYNDATEELTKLRENRERECDSFDAENARLREEYAIARRSLKSERMECAGYQQELARLREDVRLYAVDLGNANAERDKLHERNKALEAQYVEDVAEIDNVNAQRDTLLEAIREIATLCWNPAIGMPTTPYSKLHNIARSAIDEIEGKLWT